MKLCSASRTLSLFLPLISLFLLDSQANGNCLDRSGSPLIKRYFYIGEQTLPIKLEISDRISHQLITHILRILLEEVLGYANVSLVEKLDYMDLPLVLNRISGCPKYGKCKKVNKLDESEERRIPETMANLEVWIGPGFNTQSWENTGRLTHCGPLGPVGRFGWFIPYYVVESGLEMGRIYDHWRALQDDDVVKIFNLHDDMEVIKDFTIKNKITKETYCNFQGCKDGIYYPDVCQKPGSPCATLLSKYPAISNGMIQQLINHLELKVSVAWIGPHLEDYVHRRTIEGKPVLFFSWKPNAITSSKNYTIVAFPRCEDMNIGGNFPSNCAFEINQLNKLAWTGLKESAAEAVHVVQTMNFDQVQYQKLVEKYDRRPDGIGVAEVACDWVKRNKITWSPWIPDNLSDKMTIYIGGIFPLSGFHYISQGIIPAVEMAIDAVNGNTSILKNFRMELLVEDGQCSSDHVMKAFIKYVTSTEFPRIVGILGPACSDTVEALAGVAKHYHSTIISYSAEGAIFNNNKYYPYFFRTIPSNKQFKYVYLSLFQRMGWTRVATLTEEGMKYPEYLSLTQDFLQLHKISFIVNRKFPKDRTSNNVTQYLDELRRKNARIIIGDVYDSAARAIMCEAFHQGMTSRQGYAWFFPRWFARNWYDTDIYNRLESSASLRIPCSSDQMLRAIDGYMTLGYTYYNEDDKIMQEGITVREWRNNYYKKMAEMENSEPDDYAGYAYDAIWVYANGLEKLLRQNHSYIATFHTRKTTKKFVEIVNATDFQGVSGQIRFVGPSRISIIYVLQWVNKKINRVGKYVPQPSSGGFLELNESLIVWRNPSGKIPDDGREVPGQCALETLRSFLDVNCEVAIIVANIVGFGFFAIIMLIFFLFFKQRYERRVQMTEVRMKELGLLKESSMLALDQWEIARECIVINRKIGEGAFGTVYGGEVFFDDRGWVPVAVKTLKIGSSIEEKLDFLSEAEIMKQLDHKNIVRLLGVCTRGEPVYTIMEFMLYGDLKTFLLARRHMVTEKNRDDTHEVSDKRLTSMALDVARGLSYLAELKCIHRDLACRNCLVNTKRVVKIGDFGMTRPMYDSDYYRFNKKGMLPVRWMAPESLTDGLFTIMTDVWSYGVLLFEIITFGSFPFQGLSNNQVLDYVKEGNTLTVPNGCSSQMEELLCSCWCRHPSGRPTASAIVDLLAQMPRIVSPCLDLPSAVVEIEGTGSLELQMVERVRKHSVSNGRLTTNTNTITRKKQSESNNVLAVVMEVTSPVTSPKTNNPGNIVAFEYNCIYVPLNKDEVEQKSDKKVNNDPSLKSPSFQARYITLQPKGAKKS